MPKQQRKQRKGKRSAYQPRALIERRSAARVGPITAADETDVRLKFVHSSYMTNGAGGYVGKSWTPNAAYDVDPSLGSTATNGFEAYALLYSYYRVISYQYSIEVINRELDAIVVYCFNTNTAITGTSFDIYSANAYCSSALLTHVYGGTNHHTFSGSVDCSKLLGSVEAETDATTRALVTSTPTDLLYLSLYVAAGASAGTLPSGVAYHAKITMNVRFYGRNYDVDSSVFALKNRINDLEIERAKYEIQKQLTRRSSSSKIAPASGVQDPSLHSANNQAYGNPPEGGKGSPAVQQRGAY